jgi:hypothetical protein
VIAAARSAGFTTDAVKKARKRIKAKSQRHGFGKDAFYTWVLIGAIDAQFPKPGTHGTYEAPMVLCLACAAPIDRPNEDCSVSEYHGKPPSARVSNSDGLCNVCGEPLDRPSDDEDCDLHPPKEH